MGDWVVYIFVIVIVAAFVGALWMSTRNRLGGEPRRNPFGRGSKNLTASGDLGPDGNPFGQDAAFRNDPNLEAMRHHGNNPTNSKFPI